MKNLLTAHDRITSLAFAIACLALVVMLGAYLYEIAARYAFNAPTRWSSDVVQYMLCVSIALSFPLVTRDGGHVAITSFVEKLSARRQQLHARSVQWMGSAVLALTCAIFIAVAMTQAGGGIETVAAFPIPKWWLSALAAFGFGDSALHLLRQGIGLSHVQAGHEMDI
jgi:C4-dicarboxylate transporter, DctQ subunit